MCETTIRLRNEDDRLETLVENVLKLEVTPEGLRCSGALGEETFLEDVEIVAANFTHPHELIVRKKT
jgi:predicted RNA-binding protein